MRQFFNRKPNVTMNNYRSQVGLQHLTKFIFIFNANPIYIVSYVYEYFYFISEATVHHMLPLAEEYQTDDLKLRIEKFLIKGVLSQSDSITSVQIIVNIIEAEKYKLNGYLNACIDVASRKKKLTKNPKFEEISQSTQLKIGLKRIDEIDKIYSNASYRRSVKHNKFQMKDLGKHLKPYMQDN